MDHMMCHWAPTYQLVPHWPWQASAHTLAVMVAGHVFEALGIGFLGIFKTWFFIGTTLWLFNIATV
jgi:hypothetical protein